MGPNCKKCARNEIQKLVKLIDVSNTYSSLTNFEYKINEMTRNGNYINLLNLLRKICEITSDELIFGGFYSLGTSVSSREHSSGKI